MYSIVYFDTDEMGDMQIYYLDESHFGGGCHYILMDDDYLRTDVRSTQCVSCGEDENDCECECEHTSWPIPHCYCRSCRYRHRYL